MTDVTTWLKETPLPRAGRKPQHPGEVHVQGARATPVRHVARRLATDDADCDSGSQQRAAHSLIDSFAGAVNLGKSGVVVAAAGNTQIFRVASRVFTFNEYISEGD